MESARTPETSCLNSFIGNASPFKDLDTFNLTYLRRKVKQFEAKRAIFSIQIFRLIFVQISHKSGECSGFQRLVIAQYNFTIARCFCFEIYHFCAAKMRSAKVCRLLTDDAAYCSDAMLLPALLYGICKILRGGRRCRFGLFCIFCRKLRRLWANETERSNIMPQTMQPQQVPSRGAHLPDPAQYQKMVRSTSRKTNVVLTVTKAFVIGGAICLLGECIRQILIYSGVSENSAATWISVILVFCSALLTGLGAYEKLAKHGGAGTLVPITGFANAVASAAVESQTEGLILGVGAKIFTIAGPVLLYGTAAASLYGLLYLLLK